MKRNMRTAFTTLQRMGAPVFESDDNPEGFMMSAESNDKDTIWADYYYGVSTGDMYINEKVEAVMDDNHVFFEWQDAGTLSAYQS